MTVGGWLGTREPAPPPELAERLRVVLGGALEGDAAAAPEVFMAAAESVLTGMLSAGAAHRDSALDLLAVDALVTYAFEAAADAPDSLRQRALNALQRMLAVVPPAR